MRSHRLLRAKARPDHLVGRVLCHDLRGPAGRPAFRKGAILQPADLPRLLELPWSELHLLEIEAGDLHEEQAGERLARAVAGEGIEVGALAGGHWPLAARWRGILQVEVEPLRRINGLEGLSVYTLYSGQVMAEGEVVARAKIIPLVVRAEQVRAAERTAGDAGGVIRLRRFLPMRIAAVVQESLGEGALRRFRDALGEKVAWFGSEPIEPRVVEPSADSVASAIQELIAEGAQLVILAGTRAMDPLDPAFEALARLGVPLEQHGVPAHPGSLLWLARLGEVPLLGMPGCGLFSQATVFDLVLPRILAGERIGHAELAALGHGGLLTRDMAFRFPPYRSLRERGEIE